MARRAPFESSAAPGECPAERDDTRRLLVRGKTSVTKSVRTCSNHHSRKRRVTATQVGGMVNARRVLCEPDVTVSSLSRGRDGGLAHDARQCAGTRPARPRDREVRSRRCTKSRRARDVRAAVRRRRPRDGTLPPKHGRAGDDGTDSAIRTPHSRLAAAGRPGKLTRVTCVLRRLSPSSCSVTHSAGMNCYSSSCFFVQVWRHAPSTGYPDALACARRWSSRSDSSAFRSLASVSVSTRRTVMGHEPECCRSHCRSRASPRSRARFGHRPVCTHAHG